MENIQEPSYVLASRWSRVGAAVIDTLILMTILLPLMYFTGGLDGVLQGPPVESSIEYEIIMALLSVGLYSAINWTLLDKYGQTVGKRFLNIRIVNVDGSSAKVLDLVFKRYALIFFLTYVPIVGAFIAIADMIMICGKQRRALHDRIANTKVIVN